MENQAAIRPVMCPVVNAMNHHLSSGKLAMAWQGATACTGLLVAVIGSKRTLSRATRH